MEPLVSVVIVNWRVRKLLEKCLHSIFAQIDPEKVEVIVIDNDSNDGTSEMLMSEFPLVRVGALARNAGFATANNLAIKMAYGELIVLLNPDTIVPPGFFDKMIKYMSGHPAVGIVGPRLYNADGTIQASVRRVPTLMSQVIVLLKLQNIVNEKTDLEKHLGGIFLSLARKLRKFLAKNNITAYYLASDFDYNKESRVDQIMGAAMIIRRSVLDKIGLLDHKYFIWFEEVDFCERAKKAAVVIHYVPSLEITHLGGASFDLAPTVRKQVMFDRSLWRYFRKHQPRWQSLVILLLIPINIILTAIYDWFLRWKEN